MDTGTIYYADRGGWLILKFVGAIRIASRESTRLSAGLETFIHRLAHRNDFEHLVVDLRESTVIDSTFLGLLAQAAQVSMTRNQPRPALISTNPEINIILESVCFDQVFLIIREASLPIGELQPLEPVAASEREALRVMLEAHQALAHIDSSNEQRFCNVLECLNEELTHSKGPAS